MNGLEEMIKIRHSDENGLFLEKRDVDLNQYALKNKRVCITCGSDVIENVYSYLDQKLKRRTFHLFECENCKGHLFIYRPK